MFLNCTKAVAIMFLSHTKHEMISFYSLVMFTSLCCICITGNHNRGAVLRFGLFYIVKTTVDY